jgi:glucosylceramidase
MLLSALTVLATTSIGALAAERRAAAQSWTSTADGRYKLSSYDAPVIGGGNPGLDNWKFTIRESALKQEIKGFGAAVTDGTVTAFNRLSSGQRAEVLRDLTTDSGINFNLMRHTIASSDLSGDPAYTYDDNGGNPDPNMYGFNLGDRGYAMADMLAEMRRLQGNMTIIGSPWAPPAWMQLDHTLTETTYQNNLNHDYVDAYAKYFVRYIQEYEKRGAHVDAITIQNEPFNSRTDMPTMYIYADESGALIRDNVGPALRNAGLPTDIWAFDHNTNDYFYPQTVFNMNRNLVNTAAWHCYSGNDQSHWEPLTRFHNEFPNSEQYMTECWTAVGTTDWKHTSNYHMMPLQNWANGIISWALGSYTGGGPTISGGSACHICTGLVTVDPNGGGYKKEIDYYIAGQYSKFIPKGSHVLEGTGSYLFGDGTGLLSVATLNPDGSRTVVIQNNYGHDIFVQVDTEREGNTWNARVPGSSVTTWVLP